MDEFEMVVYSRHMASSEWSTSIKIIKIDHALGVFFVLVSFSRPPDLWQLTTSNRTCRLARLLALCKRPQIEDLIARLTDAENLAESLALGQP
jgi:hypothetical protein